MKCPICGARLYPGADRCQDCGCHVRSYTAPAENPAPRPARRSRGRVFLTILGLLPVLLIILFTTLISVSVRMTPEPVIPEYSITIPADRETTPLPESREDCFSLSGGSVTFLPERWDGNPVIRVPSVIDGKEVTALAPGCFASCEELTTIVLPETIREIGRKAFSGCTNLRGLYFPESTVSVGADAFAGCLGLEAIYVPGTMESIAPGCFQDCAGLLYIFYDGSFEDWDALYSEYITPFTAAICLDGTYYHGTGR